MSSVAVRVDAVDEDLVVLYYQLEGDIDQLHLPAQQRSEHVDGLWRQTCFEAFARVGGQQSYHEFNFSPSSAWAVYRFDAYRQGMRPIEPQPAPRIICRRRADRLEVDVDVHLAALAGLRASERTEDLKLAVAAVLEDLHGQRSYWALAHPPGQPDFHHAVGFTLTLPRIGAAQ